jgi:hypothetical protein
LALEGNSHVWKQNESRTPHAVLIQLLYAWLHHSPIPHGVAPQQSSIMLQTAAQRYEFPSKWPRIKQQMSSCNLSYRIPTTQNHPAKWAIRLNFV